MFGKLGVWEIILILVVVLVLFGGNKLAGVGSALGKSIRDFKREIKADDADEKKETSTETKENKAE